MRRGPALLLIAAIVALSAVAVVVLGGKVEAEASAMSHSPRGWLAARRYLEERGARVALLDHAPATSNAGGVLALAFPWQVLDLDPGATMDGLEAHLRNRGTLVLAYSGDPLANGQAWVLEALGLSWQKVRGEAPLGPWRWRRFAATEWSLVSVEWPQAARVRIEAPRGVPRMPASGRALWRGDGDVPLVFVYPRGRGRVVVLPAAALANARLEAAGNGDLLEQLRQWLGDDWTFDELHHGLTAAVAPTAARSGATLDMFLLHLALVYGLAVVALARRFGPAWVEPAVLSGSTASFLIALGGLHHRLGHHPAAARLLVERARELDPRVPAPGVEVLDVSEGKALLALAKTVAGLQGRKGGEA